METVTHPKVMLFADCSRGIYIPQFFAEAIKRELVSGVSAEDWEILENVDSSLYWEVWSDVLDNATVRIDGQTFRLYQDGDLWLIDETAECGVDHELFSCDD